MDALERAGLVQLTRTQPKRGTIEKYYRSVARTFEAPRRPSPGRRRERSLLFSPRSSPAFDITERGGTIGQLGWIQSAVGIGTIAGGLALGVWGGFPQKIRTTALGIALLGAAVLSMSALGPGRGIVSMAVVGAAAAFANGPIQAILQVTIPPEMQGRIFSLYASLAGAMTPLGLLLAAPVAEIAGVATWYVAGGALCLAVGAVMLVRPDLLDIERTGSVIDTAQSD